MKKETCDCKIGSCCDGDVMKSILFKTMSEMADTQIMLKKHGLLNGEPLTAKQLVDGRKGYLWRYNYCPYCGEKINWKELLKVF